MLTRDNMCVGGPSLPLARCGRVRGVPRGVCQREVHQHAGFLLLPVSHRHDHRCQWPHVHRLVPSTNDTFSYFILHYSTRCSYIRALLKHTTVHTGTFTTELSLMVCSVVFLETHSPKQLDTALPRVLAMHQAVLCIYIYIHNSFPSS